MMRNFYMVHDMDSLEMGFAPLANSPTTKAAPVYGEIPDCQYTDTCA